ncbi:MAG: YdiU family protein [Gammaproteobacteria bacterium]|nr:YdiU family protein [Gammaproteobacteria bacterium]
MTRHRLDQLPFDNRYAQLPAEFYHRIPPQPLAGLHLIHFNADAAALIGLDPEEARRPGFVERLSGEQALPGSEPLAMCYSGHQFGQYVPRLGDGRAILLGQVRNAHGQLWDLHLKGGGQTRYSRQGDGRAVLRSSIREYLCSEAMHGLGIATTRALCLIGSREQVQRETLEPAALLLRMAPSHVRFGSFEYFCHTNQHQQLRTLAEYVIEHFYPDLAGHAQPYHQLLQRAVISTAQLIAQWQGVGFAHGVMNSDNMAILGLTLDYGPFGFLDTYQAGYICNHSDPQGRYAFDQQPDVGLFNLGCLASAMLPLLADDQPQAITAARAILDGYWPAFHQAMIAIARRKLGLLHEDPQDLVLWHALLQIMEGQADYTILFHQLCEFDRHDLENNQALRDQFIDRAAFDGWAQRYAQRLAAEHSDDAARRDRMRTANPKYILRNYLAEQAIRRAEDHGDYSEIDTLLTILRRPYDEQPEHEHYAAYPPAWAQTIEVSCSS